MLKVIMTHFIINLVPTWWWEFNFELLNRKRLYPHSGYKEHMNPICAVFIPLERSVSVNLRKSVWFQCSKYFSTTPMTGGNHALLSTCNKCNRICMWMIIKSSQVLLIFWTKTKINNNKKPKQTSNTCQCMFVGPCVHSHVLTKLVVVFVYAFISLFAIIWSKFLTL